MKKQIHKSDRVYPIGYDLHVRHEPGKAKDMSLKGLGNADAIFFAPCFRDDDGRLVPYPFTVKEGKIPLEDTDLYDVILGIAGQLLQQNKEKQTSLSPAAILGLNLLVKNELEVPDEN